MSRGVDGTGPDAHDADASDRADDDASDLAEQLLAGATLRLQRAADTTALGTGLGRLLRAGDLVLLTGGLAAGKTTLTQGIGAGLGVRGPITSPTFVLARVHPSVVGGPALVHVDAYRLGGLAELDDLDLDASLEESVTVVEWGRGLAEDLAEDRLEISLDQVEEVLDRVDEAVEQVEVVSEQVEEAAESGADSSPDAPRAVRAVGHGRRWVVG